MYWLIYDAIGILFSQMLKTRRDFNDASYNHNVKNKMYHYCMCNDTISECLKKLIPSTSIVKKIKTLSRYLEKQESTSNNLLVLIRIHLKITGLIRPIQVY